uniref:HAT C-terminal dimerisation domain-containing protein n=1 Tax=Meloidogyne enterolobii TaxID=390850 RepID=A0A6V7W4B0_MELEN|nr:unnamed protein product [Meloidogyne enterolobii]
MSHDKSSFWFYFERVGTTVAKCKLEKCTWSVDQGPKKCTNSLQHHLKSKHPDEFSQRQNFLKTQITLNTNYPQITLKKSIEVRWNSCYVMFSTFLKKSNSSAGTSTHIFSELYEDECTAEVRTFSDPDTTFAESVLELDRYFNEKRENLNTNSMEYWHKNSDSFRNLIKIVKKFHSSPPGSIEAERLFSTAGHVVNDLRSRLTGKNIVYLFLCTIICHFTILYI